ncbi:hypothetical protein ACFVT9_08980 [Kitasatospora cineracea]|uniref:hypothetical protein n=1 Tax=Kitasatospora cineracea TaxID=88074 RepID=UPI00369F0B38
MMRKLMVGAVAVAAVAALVVPAASASAAVSATGAGAGAGASLRGWSGLSPQSTELPGFGNLTLAVDARSRPAGGGSGHATIQHEFFEPDGSWQGTVRIEVDVDCLRTDASARTAVVTGTVRSLTYTVPPGTPQPPVPSSGWHPETGFSFFLDGAGNGVAGDGSSGDGDGQARVGWSGVPDFNDPTAPPTTVKCAASAPGFYVIEGGYRLHARG